MSSCKTGVQSSKADPGSDPDPSSGHVDQSWESLTTEYSLATCKSATTVEYWRLTALIEDQFTSEEIMNVYFHGISPKLEKTGNREIPCRAAGEMSLRAPLVHPWCRENADIALSRAGKNLKKELEICSENQDLWVRFSIMKNGICI